MKKLWIVCKNELLRMKAVLSIRYQQEVDIIYSCLQTLSTTVDNVQS